jgi:Tfp pilus assembly protein PilO
MVERFKNIFKFAPRNRRHMVMIAVALVSLALIYRFLPELKELVSFKEEIELKEARIIKYKKMVREGKGLARKLAALKTNLSQLESRLLSGRSPSLAGVEIQEIIQEIASRSNLRVDRVSVLKPKDIDKTPYISIPVNFSLMLSVRQLKEVLHAIESSRVFLKVTELTVRYHRSLKWDVQCQVTVAGLMKRPKPEGARF